MCTIQGRVIDAGSNLGVPGVAVSNGEAITTTAADGSFSLGFRPEVDSHVFIAVPAGFRARSGFYRTIRDPRPDPVQFELEPFEPSSSERFTCAHVTDMHVGLEGGITTPPEVLREDFSALLRDCPHDMIIASGDLTEWGTPEQLHAMAEAADALPCPWFPLFGGHDGNHERFGGITAEEIMELKRSGRRDEILRLIPAGGSDTWTRNFETVFGPTHYSFDWGRWHFAFFPNEAFHSTVDEERKDRWLWADLERQPAHKARAVVVHIPPSPEFLDRLEQAGVKLLLHGHWHSSKIFRWGDMTVAVAPPLCFGGLDTSPRGYYRIDFDGDAFQMERRVLAAKGVRSRSPDTAGARWDCRLPGHMHRAAPVRCGNRMLASIQNPRHPGASGVACVEDNTGEIAWFLETGNVVPNRVALDVSGSRGVAVSLPGEVCVFDTATGSVCWTGKLPGYPFRWLHPAPVIAGDRVIAGGGGGYECRDLQSGTVHWYRELGHTDKWPSYSGPVAWKNLLIFAMGDGLEAIDLQTGERVWHRALAISGRYGSPVLAGDRVLHGGDCNDIDSRGEEPAGLVVLDAATGYEVWNRKVLEAGFPVGMAANDERIFVSTPHGELQAYDLDSAELCWRHATGESRLDAIAYHRDGSRLLADPEVMGEDVVLGGCDGVAVVLDSRTGALRSSYDLGAAIAAPVCILDDGFCVGTFDGRLYCFDRTAGNSATV